MGIKENVFVLNAQHELAIYVSVKQGEGTKEEKMKWEQVFVPSWPANTACWSTTTYVETCACAPSVQHGKKRECKKKKER